MNGDRDGDRDRDKDRERDRDRDRVDKWKGGGDTMRSSADTYKQLHCLSVKKRERNNWLSDLTRQEIQRSIYMPVLSCGNIVIFPHLSL